MRIKIINHELGIGACSVAGIPAAVMEGYPREEIPFFYLKERDGIVLNEEHMFYEPCKSAINSCLELRDNQRDTAAEQITSIKFQSNIADVTNRASEQGLSKTELLKAVASNFFDTLDGMIECRERVSSP